MDALFQRAKSFAYEAAKRSQELALETSKASQEIALETAKRSKEIALEAAKKSKEIASEAGRKADQFKAFAVEIAPSVATVAARSFSSSPAPEELQKYGITPELAEFVNGLTINTFQDFPLHDSDCRLSDEQDVSHEIESTSTPQELTEWQERHAVLVLKTVPEISHFRYVLCPRHMKESRFWKIYFMLVKSHIGRCEALAIQHATSTLNEGFDINSAPVPPANQSLENRESASTTGLGVLERTEKEVTSITEDQDLDAYLMGALGSSDEGPDTEDNDGFDADFDKFVNSTALDSDAEDEKDNSTISSSTKAALKIEGLSDDELLEVSSDLKI